MVAPVPPFVTGTVSDNVEPAEVTVISLVPSNATPLIFLATVNEAAEPVVSAALLGISPDAKLYDPETVKLPVISTPALVTLNLSILFTKVFTSLLVLKLIYS